MIKKIQTNCWKPPKNENHDALGIGIVTALVAAVSGEALKSMVGCMIFIQTTLSVHCTVST